MASAASESTGYRSATSRDGRDEADDNATNILIVDDTAANRFAFRELLAPLRQRIFEATSGHDGITLAARHDFAAIVLDLMMPDMDGIETLSTLRDRGLIDSTPVIMITARDLDRDQVQRAYALGVIDFVTKPVLPEVLRGKVNSCVSLHLAQRELRMREAALVMKDRQIAILAHDLRNPLSAASAAVALIERLPPSESARREQLVQRVARGLRRMAGMVRDLLDYARAGAGAIAIVRERLDLVELARELIEEFEIADPERRIFLSEEGDTTGEWDRARVYQALSNLVGNATHYGHGSAVMTIVRVGDHVAIAVHNAGPPIAPDLLPSIFEPFRRGHAEGSGLGLGLYIVRAIARAHGGEVTVTSSAQHGTTFTIRLPVLPTETASG